MSNKITHEEFVQRVKIANENIEVLEEYKNFSTKLTVRCLRHDIIFTSRPDHLCKGHGCPKCSGERITLGKTKYSKDEFIEKLKIVNPYIEVVGEYHLTHDKIEVLCKIHNIRWKSYGNVLLRGVGCKECGRNKCSKLHLYTEEEYVDMLKHKNPNVELIGKYNGMQQKTMFKCKVCGNEWKCFPNNEIRVKAGYNGCQKCSAALKGGLRTKSHERFVGELRDINEDILVLGIYEKSNVPINIQCKKCDHIWNAFPSSLLSGYGCPSCTSSKGEKLIKQSLDAANVVYYEQFMFEDCKHLRKLRFDFFIYPNTAIEFQGRQHYSADSYYSQNGEFQNIQLRDQIKRDYCLRNNIRLIEIPYWKIKEVPDIVKRLIDDPISTANKFISA